MTFETRYVAGSNIACGGPVGSPRPTCALGNSAVQRQQLLLDQRTIKRMRGSMLLIAAGLLVWFVVQLA